MAKPHPSIALTGSELSYYLHVDRDAADKRPYICTKLVLFVSTAVLDLPIDFSRFATDGSDNQGHPHLSQNRKLLSSVVPLP
jgi:hypothetical protein